MCHSGITVIEFQENEGFAVPRVLTMSSDFHLYREGLPTRYNITCISDLRSYIKRSFSLLRGELFSFLIEFFVNCIDKKLHVRIIVYNSTKTAFAAD